MPLNFFRHKAISEDPNTSPRTILLASAALVNINREGVYGVFPTTRPWQQVVWDLYDEVCEYRYGIDWLTNACSRAKLYVGPVEERGAAGKPKPTDNPKAIKLLDELHGGPAMQGGMLSRLAQHLSVPGESYMVGIPTKSSKGNDGSKKDWFIVSAEEFMRDTANGSVRIRNPESGEDWLNLTSGTTVIRIWRPHGRRAWEADSPSRPLIRPLREIVGLSAHIQATVDSRLAGSGLLIVPESATAISPAQSEGVNPLHADPFMAALIDSALTPLQNPNSASAVVPLMVRVPDASVGNFKHMTFATELDAQVQPLRDSAIRRLATGLDVPAEVLLGTAGLNHWAAWALEESSIKMHIEPLLSVMCQALTAQYLRPNLKKAGMSEEEVEKFAIYADTTELTLRPNRSPEAIRLYEVGAISSETLRRESGFDEDDKPTDEEAVRILATRMAMANSNLAPLLLRLIGIDVDPSLMPGQATFQGQTQLQGHNPNTNAPLMRSDRNLPVDQRRPQGGPGDQPPKPLIPDPPMGPRDLGKFPIKAVGPLNASGAALADAINSGIPPFDPSITAAADLATMRGDSYRFALAETAVLSGLERAGRWLLKQSGKQAREAYERLGLKPWQVHEHIPAAEREIPAMLAGSFALLQRSTPSDIKLHRTVALHAHNLILTGTPYSRQALTAALCAADATQAAPPSQPDPKQGGGGRAA